MVEKFYWWEAESFAFIRVPKVLIGKEQYATLSTEAALLYGLLLDRMCLSAKNRDRFTDKDGFIFVYYTLEKVCATLGCGKEKATRLFRELEENKLLLRKKQGRGKPARLYVLKFKQAAGKADVKTADNPESEGLQSGSPNCGKSEVNNTENNKIKDKENNLSIRKHDYDATVERIKKQLAYETLAQNGESYQNRLDEIVLIMADAICSTSPTVRIGGSDFPREVVRSRLFKLDFSHIEYVIDCLEHNTTPIANIRAYLLTMLYNAPTTMHHYYRAAVNHDMPHFVRQGR